MDRVVFTIKVVVMIRLPARILVRLYLQHYDP
jgi:hypothetical protein